MGQQPEKTYTAPDGSLFRVEADGSITKLKEGNRQIPEAQPEYHVAPDGRIYRIYPDGSYAYLGKAGDKGRQTAGKTKASGKNSYGIVWLTCIIIIALTAIVMLAVAQVSHERERRHDYNYYNGYGEEVTEPVEVDYYPYEGEVVAEEVEAAPYEGEVVAEEVEAAPYEAVEYTPCDTTVAE